MASPDDTLIADRYRIVKRLGSGGMATVFLARDERLGRDVAIKRMHAESPEEVAQRFQREARLGASLNHPNIVGVFDIETDDENVLIVMEYVEGGTLKEALADGALRPDAALTVLAGVASALDYAHEHGVLHRDVKPANVLIGADGRAKLADLGIATAAEVTSITMTGTVMGTASYMAPERLDGKEGGPAADVYALATVAYEALTGEKARTGRSAVEIARAVMDEPPPDLRAHMPGASEAAALVLSRGMARDPAERPATAGALVAELREALADRAEPTGATTPLAASGAAAAPAAAAAPTPAAAPYETHSRDRRWLAPALAGLALLAGIVLVLLLVSGGDDESSPEPTRASTADTSASTTESTPSTTTDETAPEATPEADVPEPTATVEDFYSLAAKDDFEGAWALAGAGVREQLGGFDSFKSTLGTLESIEFPELSTTLESGDAATVALRSVATHTDRVDECSGSADLTRSGDAWKIEKLNVDCAQQGAGSGTTPPQETPGKGPAGGKPAKPDKPDKGNKKEK